MAGNTFAENESHKALIMDNILSLSVRAQNKGLLRAIIWLLIAAGLFVVPVSLSAQGHICSGTVSDSDGNPVPGAFVLIQGTQDGTSTDENGEFSLTVPAGATLEFIRCRRIAVQSVIGSQDHRHLTAPCREPVHPLKLSVTADHPIISEKIESIVCPYPEQGISRRYDLFDKIS